MNQLHLYIIVLLLASATTFGQNIKVYEIQPNGTKGKLIRTETSVNNNIIKSSHYNSSGEVIYTISNTYNSNNQLTKEIKAFQLGHQYDMIREYYYDSEGRKSGVLFGNNRTGKWGSYRYHFNMYGDIDTVYTYQKNGDLIKKGIYDFHYNEQNKKVSKQRFDIDLEEEEITQGNQVHYTYNENGYDEIMIEKAANGTFFSKEATKYTLFKAPKIRLVKYEGLPETKTEFFYNSKQKLIKSIESTNGKVGLITTYKYDSRGNLVQKKYLSGGKYSGEWFIYR